MALHLGTSAQANLQTQWSDIRSTILQLALQQLAEVVQVVDVMLEGVRPLPDNCSEMTVYLLQRSMLGSTDRIPAHFVYTFLQQNLVRNVLLDNCLCPNLHGVDPRFRLPSFRYSVAVCELGYCRPLSLNCFCLFMLVATNPPDSLFFIFYKLLLPSLM